MPGLSHAQARALMALHKTGCPPESWQQHRTHRGVSTLEFGVVDGDGATIPGMHVQCMATTKPRLTTIAWKITLFQADGPHLLRVYQIDNPGLAGMRPGDHDFPHEHIGEPRQPDDPAWQSIGFNDMLDVFCQRCALTLEGTVPDPTAYQLR